MKILEWNCRGLSCFSTIQRLKQLIGMHKPYLCFLFETLQPFDDVSFTLKKIDFEEVFNQSAIGHRGGLVWAWNHGLSIKPILIS